MASIKQRPDGSWRARYRDEAHRELSRHFDTKRDAQRWLDEVTTSVITGTLCRPTRRHDRSRAVLRRLVDASALGSRNRRRDGPRHADVQLP